MQSLPETQDASLSTADTVLRVNCFERRCRLLILGAPIEEGQIMAILDGRLPRRAGVHRVVANPVLRPSFRALAGSHFSPQNRGPTGPGGSAHSKVPLCRERRMQGCAARLGAIMTKGVPRARSVRRSGLPGTLSASTMRILAPVSCQ